MKKTVISCLLAVIIMFQIIVMPVNAVISGEDTVPADTSLSYEEVVQIAVQAFPEYAKKIQRTTLSKQECINICSDENPSLIVNEVRAISDTEFVAYQEYSNGLSFVEVASVSALAFGGITDKESETVNGVTGYVLSVHMISCSQQMLEVRGIKCALQHGYYSEIYSYGTIYAEDTMCANINAHQDKWIAVTPAYIEYACGFTYVSDYENEIPIILSFTGILRVDVGPFDISVEVRT